MTIAETEESAVNTVEQYTPQSFEELHYINNINSKDGREVDEESDVPNEINYQLLQKS